MSDMEHTFEPMKILIDLELKTASIIDVGTLHADNRNLDVIYVGRVVKHR